MRDGGSLYCKEDHDVLEKTTQTNLNNTIEHNNNNALLNNNNTISNTTSLSNNNHSSELGSMSGELSRESEDVLAFLEMTQSSMTFRSTNQIGIAINTKNSAAAQKDPPTNLHIQKANRLAKMLC